jgi:hypothetical protein
VTAGAVVDGVAPVWPASEFVVGAEFVADPLLFFLTFAVGVVCAVAIDPVIRNALIQKPAANFK